jgi:multisubunit Na+/H+ antiporter MnhB subunit
MKNMKEIYMYVLGGFVVGISAMIVAMLVFYPLPETNKDIVNIALGALLGQGVTVISYFFGSSKSSADKNELLSAQNNQAKTTNEPEPK